MKVEGTVTLKDYVAAQYLHVKPRPVFKFIGVFLVSLFILTLFVSFSWGMVILIAYILAYFLLFIPWYSRTIYKQYKAIQLPFSVELNDLGLVFESSQNKSVLYWEDVNKFKKNKKVISIYPASAMFHVVPAHFFENNEQFLEFTKLVESKL